MLVDVLIEKNINLDMLFSYLVPKELEHEIELGKRVEIPFRNNTLMGFILNIRNNDDLEYKEILSVVDDFPPLNEEMIELAYYVREKTGAPLILAVHAMLPRGFKASINKTIEPKMKKILRISNKTKDLEGKELEIYNYIKNNSYIEKSKATKISAHFTKKLITSGVLEECEIEDNKILLETIKREEPKTLNDLQKKVYDKIIENKNKFYPVLLHGVTGSGKTEVYINLIKDVIDNGKTALVLVPEISLTPQIINRFLKVFGDNIAVFHSALSDREKYNEFLRIKREDVKIVIGARSAIFAQLKNIGIIIIDEEHSETYKQENHPRYDTIEIAIKRAQNYSCPLIMGSATPSLNAYTRAKMGLYELLEIKEKAGKSKITYHLVDMKNEARKGNLFVSDELKEKIKEKISKNEQVILFLNRRGHSTTLMCRECFEPVKCPNCDITLTYHKHNNVAECHYCSYKTKVKTCTNCGSEKFDYFGLGTEKLEEIINQQIEGIKTIRMDSDTTTKKNSHQKIIESFKNEEYNCLIGTQMIAKGLDFEKVTLVGIISADFSLNIPDYRSSERTFSMINQISGRTSRGSLPGEVVIQGYNLEHYSITSAISENYKNFYDQEILLRKKMNYPPFSNLIVIKIKNTDKTKGYDDANKVVKYLKTSLPKTDIILGPADANISKIRRLYQINIIIKNKQTNKFKEVYEPIKKSINSIMDVYYNPNSI